MSIELLEEAAAALGDLRDDVVFLGGATITLWITDPAAQPPRLTTDVDVVVEVTSWLDFERFQDRLRTRFREDADSRVICRWRSRDGALILDVMPSRADLLGFENRWQAEAIPHALTRRLPSGRTLRAVSPAYLVATKLEAFKGRGGGDYLASADFEDVVALVDGREELVDEVAAAPEELRAYLREQIAAVRGDPVAVDAIRAHLPRDGGSQERARAIVLPRLRALSTAAAQ